MHHHTLVNLVNHGTQSNLTLFRSLQGVNVADISCLSFPEKVGAIREHGFDVAIDLSGWTGGHFALGFLSRLAPVQVNYLGYFASSGLPTMDYWLGDDVLFREPSPEWCVERRYSLSRPFIAWQPSEQLPEFCVSVTEGPVGSIRFGSFNNNRKLSDQTLRLWGDILTRVPDSRLVLKANAGEDLATQELLARRMHRCGLDPARVEWLQLTVDATDHLLQYRHMDIALDPFPNGGCTTTCEALWMGCPVITLAGMHYVSRMSAAVLEGAGLRSLVAFTELQYVQMAIEQASDLSKLRQTRQRWRDQIKTSPLGNAADLVHHLENALSDMTQR
jgi:predicted O-linked N-acetylglucosamine transferase (SPINDLY family)